ncbi:hypothetical protein SRABI27_04284 [Pedobacter sp. Bi27]|nr:hypothetical protein SRABI27_04284 [Pedobacter sp. Bi27]
MDYRVVARRCETKSLTLFKDLSSKGDDDLS